MSDQPHPDDDREAKEWHDELVRQGFNPEDVVVIRVDILPQQKDDKK